jgi:cobalt-precorrin 5A hydrolase/precorrin-3B C17-methyltransferase
VLVCSVTAAGAALARRLPWEHRPGRLVATVAAAWDEVDAFVLVCATGIAVRAVAPLLVAKSSDPAVVSVDDAGRWAVVVAGGHAGGGNDLAREVAGLVGADAVVTSAGEAAGLPALDALPGFRADGDVAGLVRAWLDGSPPAVEVDPGLAGWPLLAGLPPASPGATTRVLVSDRDVVPGEGEVVIRPPSLVLGVGASTGADPEGLARLVRDALAAAGLHAEAVGAVATVDRKAGEPALVAVAAGLGVPLRALPAAALAGVPVPNPSGVVAAAVGTPSVAEAAALLAAGPGGRLVVEKRRTADATVAVARRARPEGGVAVVGLGPGDPSLRTPAAAAAVRHAGTVVGYGPYVGQAADLLGPHQQVLRFPIGAEAERAAAALERAAAGERVALVCSGDPGVYAMASLVCELAPAHGDPPVTVVPGVTAALAAAAVLGAPLGHDHASVSLSDLLTPWAAIEARLRAVAEADFVVSLYNPRSARRAWQLERALAVLACHRPPTTPAAVVTEVARPGQRVVRTTLAALDPSGVDMRSLVVVGSTATRWIGGRMVTPRGYPR